LTNISNGTLLNCCRSSMSFKYIGVSSIDIDNVRTQWREFLAAQDDRLLRRCSDWQDSWRIFITYKDAHMEGISNAG